IVPGVCRRADIATVGRRRNGADDARVAAAAEVALLAVPGALHAAADSSVDAAQREAHPDADVLALAGQVSEVQPTLAGDRDVDLTVGGIPTRRSDQSARHSAQLGITDEANMGVGADLEACR